MRIMVILALVALGATIALILYMIGARRRDKRNIAPEEKIGERRDDAPPVVECEASPESQESISFQPQPEVPSVEVENKPADATEVRQFPPEKVESESVVDITQPEAAPMRTETTKFPEEEIHPHVESGAAAEKEEAAERAESPRPEHETEGADMGTTEPAAADAEEGSRAKEVKPREEREPVSPENRGGRSRETSPKNQVESRKKRRPRTPKPEIVCWKREREWVLAVELPDDFAESQNVTVVQDGKQLDKDETKESCWRLSQLHGEVVVRVLDAENESLFKLPLDDAGCLIFKLSGGDRNRGRHVKRPGSGSCLVVVPKDWKRDEALAGTPPYEPEDVCLLGYRAHFFEL